MLKCLMNLEKALFVIIIGFLTNASIAQNGFTVLDADYEQAGTAGNYTVLLNGENFDRTVTVALTNNSAYRLEASQYYREGPEVLYATFDLTRTGPGNYDMTVNKTSTGESTIIKSRLQVVTGGGKAVELSVMGLPDSGALLEDQELFAFQIVCENRGNNDSYAPLIEFQANKSFSETMDPFLDQAGGDILKTYDIWYPSSEIDESLPGILCPNHIYYRNYWMDPTDPDQNSDQPQEISYDLSSMYDEKDLTVDWTTYIEMYDDITESNRLQVLDQLNRQVDTTNSGLLEMFARNARLLNREQWGVDFGYYYLIHLEIEKALAAVTTSIFGHIKADSFDIPISGIRLRANNLDTGEIYETTSLFDGSFILHNLSSGNYEVTTEEVLAQEGPVLVQIQTGQHLKGMDIPVTNGNYINISVLLDGQQHPSPEGGTVFLSKAYDDDASTIHVPTFKQLWEFHESNTLHITGLPEGQYNAIVRISGSAEAHALFSVEQTQSGIQTVIVYCIPGVAVFGRVPDDLGPVLDKSAILEGSDYENNTHIYFADWSQSEFVFQDVSPGNYKLYLRASGYATVIETVDIDNNEVSVEIGEFNIPPERKLDVRWVGDFSNITDNATAIIFDSQDNPISATLIKTGTDFVLGQMNGQEYKIAIFNSERILYKNIVELNNSNDNEWSIYATNSLSTYSNQDNRAALYNGFFFWEDWDCGYIMTINIKAKSPIEAPNASPTCNPQLLKVIKYNSELATLEKDYYDVVFNYNEAKAEYLINCKAYQYCVIPGPENFFDNPNKCLGLKKKMEASRTSANEFASKANSIGQKSHFKLMQLNAALKLLQSCENKKEDPPAVEDYSGTWKGWWKNPSTGEGGNLEIVLKQRENPLEYEGTASATGTGFADVASYDIRGIRIDDNTLRIRGDLQVYGDGFDVEAHLEYTTADIDNDIMQGDYNVYWEIDYFEEEDETGYGEGHFLLTKIN